MSDFDTHEKLYLKKRLNNMTEEKMPEVFRQAETKDHEEKMSQGIRLGFIKEDVSRTEELQALISSGVINASEARKRDLKIRDNRNRNILLLNNEKFFTGDSDKMKAVKDAIKDYEAMLRTKMEGESVMDAESQAGRAVTLCNAVIAACDSYLSRRRSIFFWRWGRRAEVENARARFQEELDQLKYLSGVRKETNAPEEKKSAFEGVENLLKGRTMLDLMNVDKMKETHRIEQKRQERERKKLEKQKRKLEKEKKKEEYTPSGKLHLEKLTDEELKAPKKARIKANQKEYEFNEDPEKLFKKDHKSAIKFTSDYLATQEDMFRELDKKRLEEHNEKKKELEENTPEKILIKKIQFYENQTKKTDNILKKLADLKNELKSLPELEKKQNEDAVKSHDAYVKYTAKYDQDEKKASEKKYNDYIAKNMPVLKQLLSKKKITAKDKIQINKIQQDIVLMQDQMITDRSVYVRNATDMELKKKLSFGTFKDLSEFAELFENREGFDNLLKEYGTGSKTAALDTIAGELEKFQINPDELFNESVLLDNMDKYIHLSKMVEAFNRLLSANPDYLKGKSEVKTGLDKLTAVSDYVRIKKQIVLSPMYLSQKEVNLTNYSEKREDFRYRHYRRLLMVDRMMERNLKISLGMKIEADPILENKNSNVYAEEDRQYALRLSNETKLQKQIDRKTGTYKRLMDRVLESIKKIRKLKEITESKASDTEKQNAALDLQAEKLYFEELQRKILKEESTDPQARKSEALMTLEEERLHVPFDFNMVDFDHIPDKRKGDIYDVCAMQENLRDDSSEIRPDNVVCKKMGYEKFQAWIATFKKNNLIGGQLGEMRFRGTKSVLDDIIYTDNYDRIVHHYKGSYHFHFTDAQMREQFSALAFIASKEKIVYQDDPEAMAYQESLFRHMILQQNAQMQGAVYRNLYGGINKFMYMTCVDRRMVINAYQKMDLMCCMPYSNIDTEQNSGKYLKFCHESNNEGRFMTMIPDHLCMGADLSWSVFNIHGCLTGLGLHDPMKLNNKMKKEYDSFVNDYKKKHPKAGYEEFGLQFMLSHPQLFSKSTFLKPIENPEEELNRKQFIDDSLHVGVYGRQILKLLHNEYVEELTPEQIEKYRKRAKKDGFDKYDRLLRILNEVPVGTDVIPDLDNLNSPDFDVKFEKRHYPNKKKEQKTTDTTKAKKKAK